MIPKSGNRFSVKIVLHVTSSPLIGPDAAEFESREVLTGQRAVAISGGRKSDQQIRR
jgi:hypothetical protein